MKLELTVFNCMCETKVFKVNDIYADENDFGEHYDHKPYMSESRHGCGYMKFDRIPAEEWVLKKYNISLDEYNEVCDRLEKELTFGTCSWCE